MTRAEHMAWCKTRALEYAGRGEMAEAIASMASDLGKHPETQASVHICELGLMLMISGRMRTKEEMRKWIMDFN